MTTLIELQEQLIGVLQEAADVALRKWQDAGAEQASKEASEYRDAQKELLKAQIELQRMKLVP